MTWNWVGRYEEVYNMCEKNLEGKVLSLSSNDDTDEASNNDIEEETIIDDSIDDEIEEEIIKPKKRSYKKKKKKTTIKICQTCGEDIIANEDRNLYRYMDTYAQLQAKDYCEEHERVYSDHKCKPCWCGDCGFLTKYEIEVQAGK